MPVVRIDLEVDEKGGAKITQVAGQLKDLGAHAKSAGDAIKNGFLERIGHQALDSLLAVLKSVPTAMLEGARASIDYGSHLTDMEARTGVAVEAQQELDHAAKLVGLTFEGDVVPALGKMQKALIETPEKFDRLGLSISDLRKMKPDEQFQAIAEKIGGIKDPAERAAAAIDIFGKSGATLLPLLTSNIAAAREEAERLGLVMSADVAHAADDLGDSISTLSAVWDGLVRNLGAAIVTSEPLHVLIQGLTEIVGEFSKSVHDGQGELRGWVDGGVIIAAQAISVLVGALGYGIDAWTTFQVIVIGVKASVEILVTWLSALADATLHPSRALDAFKGAMTESKRITEEATEQVKAEIAANIDRQNTLSNVQVKVDSLAKKVAEADGVTHKATATTKEQTAALNMAAAAMAKFEAASVKAAGEAAKASLDAKQNFTLLGESVDNLTIDMGRLAEQVDRFGGVSELSDTQLVKVIDDMQKMALAGGLNEEGFRVLAEAMQEAADRGGHVAAAAGIATDAEKEGTKATKKWAEAHLDLAEAAIRVGEALGGTFGAMVAGLGTLVAALAAQEKQAADNLREYGTESMTSAQKTKAITGAVEGAVSAFNAGAAASSKFGAAMSGAMSGAAAGAAFGPWGAAIGAVGGAILGLFGHAKKLREENHKLLQSFVDQAGGLDALKKHAEAAGVSLGHAFDGFVEKKLTPIEQELKRIKDQLDTWDEAQKDLNDAVERYGFTLDELGPKFAQQKLDEQMGQILQDWRLLAAAGVDHQAMLDRIGPKVGELVDQYVSAGVEIPSAMKPVIDDLYEHHKLLHANGEEYSETEYQALKYGHTTSEMFDALLAKIDKLVNALLGIPDKTTTVTTNHHDNYYEDHYRNEHGGGGGGGEGENSEAFVSRVGSAARSTGGLGAVNGGASSAARGGRGPAGGPSTIIVPVSIGGRKIDEVILQRTRAGWMKVGA